MTPIGSKRVNYAYDTGGNLLTIEDDVSSGSTTYASYTGYNALGQIEGITYGNGVDTAYTYNPNNSLLSTIDTDTSTGTALIDRSYTFDNIGSITNITDNIDGTDTQTFTYDALDRLITANSGNYGSLTYAYDTIGNFTSKRGITYTYGAKPHAVTATSNSKTYTYDANGNMTADTNRAITYNYDNKPSSITTGGQTAIFYYDGSGSRVKKLTGSSTTIYIGKLYEVTGGNITRYIFAGGTRIASKTSADTYYYHQDHLGSSSVITNSSGVKVEEIRYYPFGETFSDSSPSVTKHKYTSQELGIETGLYYYNARYYDPELGRFISADTIVPDPTNPQALNRYSYVKNNPLKYTDPTGHWSLRKSLKRLWRGTKKFLKSQAKSIVRSWTEPFSSPEKAVIQTASYFLPDPIRHLTQRFEGTKFYNIINKGVDFLADAGRSYGTFSTKSSVKNGGSNGSMKKAVSTPFTNKDGSQHVPGPSLGNHGLVDSNPYLTGNYNSEDAVWKLMNAVQSTGGINKKKAPKNWPLIMSNALSVGEIVGVAGFSYGVHGSGGEITPLSLLIGAGGMVVGTLGGVYLEYKKQDFYPHGTRIRNPGMGDH